MIDRCGWWFVDRADWGPLFIRVAVGVRLVEGTQDNVFSYARMEEFAQFLAAHGTPFPLVAAFLSVYAQFICGILIVLGLCTRPAGAVIAINFVFAILIAHRETAFAVTWPALMMLAAGLFFLFHGPGALAMDRWLKTATSSRWMASRVSRGGSPMPPRAMRSEAAERADFSGIRYAQVWEDADVLLAGLDVRPGDVCLSIASAGDNTLALLTADPARVVALDLSPAQLACLELRVAAYKTLAHGELLELIGSRPSSRRLELFDRCKPALAAATREFWDRRRAEIPNGIGSIGRFERYFALFRSRVLPLVHGRPTVAALLEPRSPADRRRFYDERWDTWRWRLLFRVFFSRTVMGRLGRDPSFFRYVERDVAAAILGRTRHALRELDPSDNPYVHWILTGTHGAALPLALRAEHFETIRSRLDRLEWHCRSLEDLLAESSDSAFDRFNLSDLFEYVSPEHYHRMLEAILRRSRPGARLAYWNMLASRRRPDHLASRLRSLDDLARRLHESDRAFFYSAFRVEEVTG